MFEIAAFSWYAVVTGIPVFCSRCSHAPATPFLFETVKQRSVHSWCAVSERSAVEVLRGRKPFRQIKEIGV